MRNMKFLKFFFIFLFVFFIFLFFLFQSNNFQNSIVNLGIKNLVLPSSVFPKYDALSALVCGSKSPLAHPTRAETCILIKAGDKYFIFDVGDKSVSNLMNWRIPLDKLEYVFISHLHIDHYSDIEDLHMWSWVGMNRGSKLKVYGPDGIKEVLGKIEDASQIDYRFRNEHHGDNFAPLDIAGFDAKIIQEFNVPIYDKDQIKISAFPVNHHPIDPSLGFKIEYKNRSIVISGDTIYSENVLKASKNVDVLFHEAMSKEILNMLYEALPIDSLGRVGIKDIQNYHTEAIDAARLAKKANVQHLILYHLLPAPRNYILENIFVRGLKEEFKNFTLSNDGTIVFLPTNSKEIIIREIK